MKRSSVIINNCYLIFGIACILFYLVCGITVRFGQSLLFLWPMLGAVCIARWLLWRQAWKSGRPHPFPGWMLTLMRCVILACLAVFCYVECYICSAAFSAPKDGLDAIIVLGARVDEDGPSGSLNERIAAAAEYLRRNPDTIAVASGGQGEDEPMSESQCIYERLTALGIDPGRILIEDRSTSTKENLVNSFALLEGRAESVGLVTNDFHVFRALCTGRALGGFLLSSVPARSSVSGFIHYAMREFFALVVSRLRGDLVLPFGI